MEVKGSIYIYIYIYDIRVAGQVVGDLMLW